MAYPTPAPVAKFPSPSIGPASPYASQGGPSNPMMGKKSAHGSWLKGLITLLVVLIIVGGGIYLVASYTGIGGSLFSSSGLSGNWQAVFLDSGQVYFGKVTKIGKDTVTLQNIYYLQVVTQPLQESQGETAAATNTNTNPDQQRLTLVKLGNEIHGPKDEMVINRSHVVLMEDLKDDSRVVQAINDYVKQQAAK